MNTKLQKNIISKSKIKVKGDFHLGDRFELAPKKLEFSNNLTSFPSSYIPRTFLKTPEINIGDNWTDKYCSDLTNQLINFSKIIILGDAGFGKSIEIKSIGYQLIEKKYQICFLELKDLEIDGIKLPPFEVQEKDKINIENKVLLLDGLDEVNIQNVRKRINEIVIANPNLKIVTSCRSNVYNKTLEGFQSFYLQKFSHGEFLKYLENRIPKERLIFINSIPSQEIKELLYIPFYLDKAIQYFTTHENNLPKSKVELLEYFINEGLNVRLGDNSNLPINQPSRKYCREKLTQLAFVMECKAVNSISKNLFYEIIGESEEVELVLNKSSLVHIQNNQFRYAHRIMQEYLAALVLSRVKSFNQIKRIIAFKPEYKKVKSSWLNTLSFLFSLINKDASKKSKFMKWLLQVNPEMLAKFEKDKVEKKDREKILQFIFKKHKKENSIFSHLTIYSWELATFGESKNTVDYLIKELKKAKISLTKNNALSLLNNIQSQYVFDIVKPVFRKLLFKNIYDTDINTPYVRHLSMEVLFRFFNDISLEEFDNLFKTFFNSNDAHERMSIYSGIKQYKLQIKYMNSLLERLIQLDDSNWRGEVNLADEDWRLEKCFEGLKSEKELIRFFESYSLAYDNWTSTIYSDPFDKLLEKAIEMNLSEEGAEKIYNSMRDLFFNLLYGYRNTKEILILRFIKTKGFGKIFLDYCLTKSTNHSVNIISELFEKDDIPNFILKYKSEKFDNAWVQNFIEWIGRKDKELGVRLVEQLNKNSEFPFKLIIHPTTDFNRNQENQKEMYQKEKSYFFSKEKFISAVQNVFEEIGKVELAKDEVFDFRSKDLKAQGEFYAKYPSFILEGINVHCPISKSNLVKILNEKWDWISVFDLRRFLIHKKREEIDLNTKEILTVKNWCDSHYPKMDLEEKVTNADIVFAHYVIKYGFIDYSKDIYLKMVASGLQNNLGSGLDIIDFVSEKVKLSTSEIAERILKKIEAVNIKSYEIHRLIRFINKNKLKDAIPVLMKFLENNTIGHLRNEVFNAYKSCGGNNEFLWQLMSNLNDDDDFIFQLIDYFVSISSEEIEEFLIEKFNTSNNESSKLRFANYLLQVENLIGLRYMVSYSEMGNRNPFTQNFSTKTPQLKNSKGLKYLLRLFELGYKIESEKDQFETIHRQVRAMIFHIIFIKDGKYFEKVIQKIISKISKVSIKECKDGLAFLRKDLEFQYYQKQEISIEKALRFYKKISSI